ncbi:hypothetical protein PIB30_059515 [Stylosanthes scabra]|uniref:Uncharacterized protein n=1 Tax=Stylosanthes scabra TaxID=79078 RepID=A0ABU6ZIY8_9FABA|nr:hypothetical protein [Stylosanthes scabra]
MKRRHAFAAPANTDLNGERKKGARNGGDGGATNLDGVAVYKSVMEDGGGKKEEKGEEWGVEWLRLKKEGARFECGWRLKKEGTSRVPPKIVSE